MATPNKIDDSTQYWADVLSKNWGIKSKLTRLDGEYDLNFLAISTSKKHLILKVMRENCPEWLVKSQISAMQHIEKIANLPTTPRVFLSLDGQSCIEVADKTGNSRYVWTLEYIPGKCLAKLRSKPPSLIKEIGEALGATTKALSNYKNKNSVKFNRRLPELKSLNRQVIQNDPNDYNIIIAGDYDEQKTVSGIIDFGDMCVAPRVCEVAIAGAYIVLDAPSPEKSLVALVSGFNKTCPLTKLEIDMIWDLLLMRLAVSVVNSTMLALEFPNDPYVTVTQKLAARNLYPMKEEYDLGFIKIVVTLPRLLESHWQVYL